MRLAIVHYHLRRGGVTRVIETAISALTRNGFAGEIVVLTGEAPAGNSPLAHCHQVVPGLGYWNRLDDANAPEPLASHLIDAASTALGGPPELWHFHNHSLGKNVATPAVVSHLVSEGARVLLQIHDFPEDGRPENFRRQRDAIDPVKIAWYPDAPQVHYAVLNRRDARFLSLTGLPETRLHLLPNAVSPPPEPSEEFDAKTLGLKAPMILYPTRAIRRKNLGELLLLAALDGGRHTFAPTLIPENPEWLAIHDRWQSVAARHRLPVHLGITMDSTVPFGDWIAAAESLITTSVAEGFGLAFLEPWLAGKTVVGRDLPDITGDFFDQGVALDRLYRRLELPVSWIDSNALQSKLEAGLSQAFRSYDRPLPDDAVERAYMAAVADGNVDFGRLDEELQEGVLDSLLNRRGMGADLDFPDFSPAPDAQLSQNAAAIESAYGEESYGSALMTIYQSILDSPVTDAGFLDGGRLLDSFLDP
ncbi:MAG: glycosyltransferase family 4 protein, partial [Verrucomicrobiae bacterium]|nr:glycosyltransferase family 4 protein [Verrucomicrobiae bacterium]